MSGWWHRGVLHKLTKEGKKGLHQSASFDIYVESLDITRTLMIFDRNWHDVFTYKLPIDHRSYAKELIGVRNAVAHHGIKDCDACYAWRALDTMARLMQGIDDNASQEVRNLIEQYYCNPYFYMKIMSNRKHDIMQRARFYAALFAVSLFLFAVYVTSSRTRPPRRLCGNFRDLSRPRWRTAGRANLCRA